MNQVKHFEAITRTLPQLFTYIKTNIFSISQYWPVHYTLLFSPPLKPFFTFYLIAIVFIIFSIVLPHADYRNPILHQLDLYIQKTQIKLWMTCCFYVVNLQNVFWNEFVESVWLVYFMVEEAISFHIWVDCEGKDINTSRGGSEDTWRGRGS